MKKFLSMLQQMRLLNGALQTNSAVMPILTVLVFCYYGLKNWKYKNFLKEKLKRSDNTFVFSRILTYYLWEFAILNRLVIQSPLTSEDAQKLLQEI